MSVLEEPHKREKYSSRCSKAQHNGCSGIVNKKRSGDKLCKCPCHEDDQQ